MKLLVAAYILHLNISLPKAFSTNLLWKGFCNFGGHYSVVIMSAIASQITSILTVYSTICSCADQTKHQSFASLASVPGIRRWPVNSLHKVPVTWKMFDGAIMNYNCRDVMQSDITELCIQHNSEKVQPRSQNLNSQQTPYISHISHPSELWASGVSNFVLVKWCEILRVSFDCIVIWFAMVGFRMLIA